MSTAGTWDVQEVAKHLGLATHTIYRLAKRGIIPGAKIGKCYRFKPTVIEKWYDFEMKRQTTCRIAWTVSRRRAEPDNSARNFLENNA